MKLEILQYNPFLYREKKCWTSSIGRNYLREYWEGKKIRYIKAMKTNYKIKRIIKTGKRSRDRPVSNELPSYPVSD